MENREDYIDKLKERRGFFHRNFPMIKISRLRTDVDSVDVLKNSCPVCGYLTLDERNSFDICGICFWEDDGVDDFEDNESSGPNGMTLKEGRLIFQEAKRKLLSSKFGDNDLIDVLKDRFLKLDNLIGQDDFDKVEIIRLQKEILDLLAKNEIWGIENLFI